MDLALLVRASSTAPLRLFFFSIPAISTGAQESRGTRLRGDIGVPEVSGVDDALRGGDWLRSDVLSCCFICVLCFLHSYYNMTEFFINLI